MMAAAPQRPSAGDAITAVHYNCSAEWPKSPAADHSRVAAINFAGRPRRKIPSEHTVATANHYTPAGSTIYSRYRFDDLDEGNGINLSTT
jgi:hypothetical protein